MAPTIIFESTFVGNVNVAIYWWLERDFVAQIEQKQIIYCFAFALRYSFMQVIWFFVIIFRLLPFNITISDFHKNYFAFTIPLALTQKLFCFLYRTRNNRWRCYPYSVYLSNTLDTEIILLIILVIAPCNSMREYCVNVNHLICMRLLCVLNAVTQCQRCFISNYFFLFVDFVIDSVSIDAKWYFF